MNADTISLNNLVKLRYINSPNMLVMDIEITKTNETRLWVAWFDKYNILHTEKIPIQFLEKVSMEKKG